MHLFSSNHSLSGSSGDSKPMFMGGGGRREPLIPSSYHTTHRIHQTMSGMPLITGHHTTTLPPPPPHQPPPPPPQQPPPPPPSQTTLNNYPCVHPHHSMIGSPCSPSISSNSINIWTTIGNQTLKNHEKIPSYAGVTTLSRMKTIELEHRKRPTWRSRKRLCFLLLGIGCVLTFLLLLFSLIFYLLVFQKSAVIGSPNVSSASSSNSPSYSADLSARPDVTTSHSNSLSALNSNSDSLSHSSTFNNVPSSSSSMSSASLPAATHHFYNRHHSNPHLTEQLLHWMHDKTSSSSLSTNTATVRRRATRKLDCEFVVLNRAFRPENQTHELALIQQSVDFFLRQNLHLSLNRSEITQYRRAANPGRLGIVVNFELYFSSAMPNAGKRLAFFFKNFYKDELAIDFRTLRITPVYDANTEYIDVNPSEDSFLVHPELSSSSNSLSSSTMQTKSLKWSDWSNWTECDCPAQVLVRSRTRSCIDLNTGKRLNSYYCDGPTDVDGEHGFSLEIKDCECPPPESTSAPLYDLQLSVCAKCDRHRELCLAYVDGPPSCVQLKTPGEPCGGHCNSKSEECKYDASTHLHRCVPGGNGCYEDEFRCSNGLCIPKIKQCDGVFNCYDYSDEFNCPCDIESGEYMHCGNKTSCIHVSKRCNDVEECWDRLDEENCFDNCDDQLLTDRKQFQCLSKSRECINMSKFCDGHRDCEDGSDETECAD